MYLSDKYQFFRKSDQKYNEKEAFPEWVKIPHIIKIKRKNKP